MMFLVLTIMQTSCSRINVESQERYRQQNSDSKTLRHGIVPLSSVLVKIPDDASVSRGKILYENHCIACHGPKGQGDGPKAHEQKNPPTNLKELIKDVPDFDFFMSVSNWKGDMPGWKEKFTQTEMDDIKSYLKTFKTR